MWHGTSTWRHPFLPEKHFFIFLKKVIIFLVFSSKYPDLKLDMLTRVWALGYTPFVAPSLDHWTFLLEAKRDKPSHLCFVFCCSFGFGEVSGFVEFDDFVVGFKAYVYWRPVRLFADSTVVVFPRVCVFEVYLFLCIFCIDCVLSPCLLPVFVVLLFSAHINGGGKLWSVTSFFFFTNSAKTPFHLHSIEWSALHLLLSQPVGSNPGLCWNFSMLSFAILFCNKSVAENIPVLSGRLVDFLLSLLEAPLLISSVVIDFFSI